MPYSLLAQIKEREGEYGEALDYIIRELTKRPTPQDFVFAFSLLRKSESPEVNVSKLLDLLQESKEVFCEDPFGLNNVGVELIKMEAYEHADKVLSTTLEIHNSCEKKEDDLVPYVQMNRIQIKRHQGIELTKVEKAYLTQLVAAGPPLTALGAQILLGDYANATNRMKKLLKDKTLSAEEFNDWPIFKLLPFELTENGDVVEKLVSAIQGS